MRTAVTSNHRRFEAQEAIMRMRLLVVLVAGLLLSLAGCLTQEGLPTFPENDQIGVGTHVKFTRTPD